MKSRKSLKSSKGSVGIESLQNRLRLRLPRQLYDGKQKYLTLGLTDNPSNRKIAEAKAKLIESDIALERFDASLEKYRSVDQLKRSRRSIGQKTTILQCSELNIAELWKQYVEYRKPQVSPTTVANQYAAVTSHLNKLPTQKIDEAVVIRDWLINNLSLDTAKRTLVQLGACCRWAEKSKLATTNPFSEMAREIKVPKHNQQEINPFTPNEQQAIIESFSDTRYSSLVKFLFMTGCRTGEALGLKWKHVASSCQTIIFTESLSGQQQITTDTKTHKPRKFPCNQQLQKLLREIKPKELKPDDYVFNIGKLRTFQDNWKRAIESLVAEGRVESYRSQYNTRHTFITHCLEAGVSVVQISRWVGNSSEIIMKHYAGTIKQAQVPEF